MEYTITYVGQGVSWNQIYGASGKNSWKIRKTLVDRYKKIFTVLLLEAKLPWFNEYEITLEYNSRHDLDNAGCMIKCLQDCFKQDRLGDQIIKKGWVHDDSKKYCKRLTIVPNESLENNTFKFILKKLK